MAAGTNLGLAATMSYQWERSANGTSGWTPIANETYNSYTLGHDDVDQYVRVVVEASNVVGSTDVAVVAGQIGSAIAAAPTVTATDGNAQVALSWTTPATNGGILRGFIVEQNDGSGWTQVGGQLSTATTSLTITGLSNAQSYDFRVRALTTLAGLNGTATGRIPYTVPSNTVLPSISGSVAVNETVSANDGSWNGNGRSITSTTYQWQSSNDNGSSWNAINLATNAQYSVPAGLQGQLLRVVVTRVNPAGSTIAVAVGVLVAAGVPTVDTAAALAGTATVGYALTGTDAVFTAHDSAGVTLSGRWEVSANGSTGWTAIAGATSASYTATSAENGKYLRFVSIATNSLNATESASTASAQLVPTRMVDRQCHVVGHQRERNQCYHRRPEQQHRLLCARRRCQQCDGHRRIWRGIEHHRAIWRSDQHRVARTDWRSSARILAELVCRQLGLERPVSHGHRHALAALDRLGSNVGRHQRSHLGKLHVDGFRRGQPGAFGRDRNQCVRADEHRIGCIRRHRLGRGRRAEQSDGHPRRRSALARLGCAHRTLWRHDC